MRSCSSVYPFVWNDARSRSPDASGFRTRWFRNPNHEPNPQSRVVRVRKPLDIHGRRRNDHPMDLDHDACYRALRTRDPRFDGRLFIGVTTTGIYCRPVCPARTPKRENVVFFPSAAAAQEAGFRPCLRCRPETAPDLAAWRGTLNTVSRALALIEEGAMDEADVDAVAVRLGV